jgi:fido (protein-threonine AMPylation protein)
VTRENTDLAFLLGFSIGCTMPKCPILIEERLARIAPLGSPGRQKSAARPLHPISRAALAHHRLAAIHPFIDGNGHTARLVLNLLILRDGFPPTMIRRENRWMPAGSR